MSFTKQYSLFFIYFYWPFTSDVALWGCPVVPHKLLKNYVLTVKCLMVFVLQNPRRLTDVGPPPPQNQQQHHHQKPRCLEASTQEKQVAQSNSSSVMPHLRKTARRCHTHLQQVCKTFHWKASLSYLLLVKVRRGIHKWGQSQVTLVNRIVKPQINWAKSTTRNILC